MLGHLNSSLLFASVLQMQKLMKAAKEGTKDGLEKTKAAVKRGRSFIRTKSFASQGPEPIFTCSMSLAQLSFLLGHWLR